MTTVPTLRKLIRFARHVEDVALNAHKATPQGAVAYGILVAQRRLAVAVLTLGQDSAYESRILLRTMIEHYFNLSWLLLRAPVRRCHRFLAFLSLDRLRILQEMPPEDRRPDHAKSVKRLRAARARHRHLFRHRDPKTGKLTWDKNWAQGLSFEARVRQVQTTRPRPRAPQITNFAYPLYRWFSAPVHGSALHLHELLAPSRRGARPRTQPDPNPAIPVEAASILLLGCLHHVSRVLKYSTSMTIRFASLHAAVVKGVHSAT